MLTDVFTVGSLARHFGVPTWQVRRLFERGLCREPGRLGPIRVFTRRDLPRVERALLAAGYLPAGEVVRG